MGNCIVYINRNATYMYMNMNTMFFTDKRKEPIVMFSCRHSNQQRHLNYSPA